MATQHLTDGNQLFIAVLLTSCALMGLVFVAILCLLSALDRAMTKLLRLFLEIPAVYLKILLDQSEAFVNGFSRELAEDTGSFEESADVRDKSSVDSKAEKDLTFTQC